MNRAPDESTLRTDLPFDSLWQIAIDAAATEGDLLDLARNFIGNWSPVELSALPPACVPKLLDGAKDVSLITFRLKRAYCGPYLTPPEELQVSRMLAFFQAVLERLLVVQGHETPDSSSESPTLRPTPFAWL